jgi:hypothetical protein
LNQQNQIEAQADEAHRQQLQRLRYQATLAQRQFDRVDPDNRLVTAELERRWENALRELKQAEEAYLTKKKPSPRIDLPPELKVTFKAIGQKLPEIWHTPMVSTATKKALLRCLIDKVVIHRFGRDQVHTRIVWKGGATTTLNIPIPVGSFAELSFAREMERLILEWTSQGIPDEQIAKQLTDRGYRSPMKEYVLPSTVKGIRLKHRVFITPGQSHPRQIPGHLTVPQVAARLEIPRHWIYDRINTGRIQMTKDSKSNLYLFPDKPETMEKLHQLKNGEISRLKF